MPALAFEAFEYRLAAEQVAPSQVRVGRVEGGVPLAYELYLPAGPFRDLLVFYHGGGANMRAGYDRLAAALVAQAPVAVCLTDVRGHGASGGRRGHTERPSAVWQDVDRVVTHLRRAHPGVRLHLGGHSSGAGLLVNALTHGWPKEQGGSPVASLVLLAPNVGFYAGLERTDAQFGGASFWPFVVHSLSGGMIAGGMSAVTLDYARARRAREIGCVERYTVNMALAVTPSDPGGQLGRLALPMWVGLAGADEIIDPDKTADFFKRHAPAARIERLAGSTHLDIILDAAPAIAAALRAS